MMLWTQIENLKSINSQITTLISDLQCNARLKSLVVKVVTDRSVIYMEVFNSDVTLVMTEQLFEQAPQSKQQQQEQQTTQRR